MKYAIVLDSTGRILCAAEASFAPADAVAVVTLPAGDVHEYRYVNGGYVHDPLPPPKVEPAPPSPIDDLTAVTVDHEYRLIMMEMGVAK
ncbi:MAG: hypothetical protein RR816_10660 [Clostridia bacterium]